MARRIHDTLRIHPWLVCEIDDRLAGYAYASAHRVRRAYQWSVDTSVYVDERYRRRGVGCGLYDSLLAILTAQGYVNAYAGITLPNPASVAVHEAVGFKPIGVYRGVGYKLGRWCDVGWWERGVGERSRSPRSPQAIVALAREPGWDGLLRRGESLIRTPSA